MGSTYEPTQKLKAVGEEADEKEKAEEEAEEESGLDQWDKGGA